MGGGSDVFGFFHDFDQGSVDNLRLVDGGFVFLVGFASKVKDFFKSPRFGNYPSAGFFT